MPEEPTTNISSGPEKNTKEYSSIDKTKYPKASKFIIYGALIVILVVLLVILAYINLFAGKDKKGEKKATSSAAKVVEEDTEKAKETEVTEKKAYCTNGTIYENAEQGQKVCLIKGWYHSEFDAQAKNVGFDPNPILEASEYGGIIVVNVSTKTVGEVVTETNDNLEGETSSTVTVDTDSATQISGNIPTNSFYYAGYKEINSIFNKFSRTYEVTMISDPAKLASNQALYNDFLAGWRFLSTATRSP